jgi:ABC-2 type transport system ATP-binding protein
MIVIEQLTRNFGPIAAVSGIDLSVAKGEVLGFLGPNGAGKSTTMKMIAGYLTPTSGRVSICGHDVETDTIAAQVHLGYLPEGAPAYGDMTPRHFLSFIAQVRGFSGKEAKRRTAEAAARTELEPVLEQPIDTLSKGFKRRVGLAQAILHDPPVLVMDEPTDPRCDHRQRPNRGGWHTRQSSGALAASQCRHVVAAATAGGYRVDRAAEAAGHCLGRAGFARR